MASKKWLIAPAVVLTSIAGITAISSSDSDAPSTTDPNTSYIHEDSATVPSPTSPSSIVITKAPETNSPTSKTETTAKPTTTKKETTTAKPTTTKKVTTTAKHTTTKKVITTAKPTTTKKVTTTKNPENSRTVYITETGKKYHYENPCGNGTYFSVSLSEAKSLGLEPCKKCVLH